MTAARWLAVIACIVSSAFSVRLMAAEAAFEIASLKSVRPAPPYPIDLGNTAHGKVTLTNVTLSDCLKFAYNIRNEAQISGPEWIRSRTELFSVIGQAAPDTPKDELRLMTQQLLAERFQLVLRREQKELSYLALVVDRKGLRLRESAKGADAASSGVRSGKISANLAMSTLAVLLARFTRNTVVDLTGLKGAYEVNLEWAPEDLTALKTAEEAAAGASIFAALQEQCGLRLESRKGPMDVIVVEHAEHTPLGN
jgi:uncharacterized protein (TIGR03435 family)